MTAHLTQPSGAAAEIVAQLAQCLPRLTTQRLILRPCQLSDWPKLEPIWTSQRAEHFGGPFSAQDAWTDFNQLIAGWLLRGHGGLTITDRQNGTVLGLALLGHELGDPMPELGWLLTETAEGQGYATEAALALRDWGSDLLGPGHFVSYIARDNTASLRVAEKLGATASAPHPIYPDVTTYRYGSLPRTTERTDT